MEEAHIGNGIVIGWAHVIEQGIGPELSARGLLELGELIHEHELAEFRTHDLEYLSRRDTPLWIHMVLVVLNVLRTPAKDDLETFFHLASKGTMTEAEALVQDIGHGVFTRSSQTSNSYNHLFSMYAL
jgi:hypothetical protein